MTRYAKINFPLQVSSTSSYGDQLLPGDLPEIPETFDAGRSLTRLGAVAADGDVRLILDLQTWTSIRSIYVYNHEDSDRYVNVNWASDPTDLTVFSYTAVYPGSSILIPYAAIVDDLFGFTDATVIVGNGALTGDETATFDLVILGE